MKVPHHWKRGSALVITLFISMVLTVISLYAMDKIVPISRATKGIENGNSAYYLAHSGIEATLFALDKNNPWAETSGQTLLSGGNKITYSLSALTKTIPLPGEGNSEFGNGDWNRFSGTEPLQFNWSGAIDWDATSMIFRIPNIAPTAAETLANTWGMILWSITSDSFQGYASGATGMVGATEITNVGTSLFIGNKQGIESLSGSGKTFKQMYGDNCISTGCTIKFSLVKPLKLSIPANSTAPYLEYKINIGGARLVPNQYATIKVEANMFGFAQTIIQRIRQRTSVTGTEFATIN